MLRHFRRFLKDESGTTAIEYGLIAALVSVAIVGALTTMSGYLQGVFNYIGTQLNSATQATTSTSS